MENEKEEGQAEKPEAVKTTASAELIRTATAAAERLEKANKKHEELIQREESLRVEKILAGKADAGEPQQKKEETPKEYAMRVMRGGTV